MEYKLSVTIKGHVNHIFQSFFEEWTKKKLHISAEQHININIHTVSEPVHTNWTS